MRFDSLSEAIQFYTLNAPNPNANAAPYGTLALETGLLPQNINALQSPQPVVMTYGVTIWGQGQVINIPKPII